MKIIIELEAVVVVEGDKTIDELLKDDPPCSNVSGYDQKGLFKLETGRVIGWREQPPSNQASSFNEEKKHCDDCSADCNKRGYTSYCVMLDRFQTKGLKPICSKGFLYCIKDCGYYDGCKEKGKA